VDNILYGSQCEMVKYWIGSWSILYTFVQQGTVLLPLFHAGRLHTNTKVIAELSYIGVRDVGVAYFL
jgi:hypothetical protein